MKRSADICRRMQIILIMFTVGLLAAACGSKGVGEEKGGALQETEQENVCWLPEWEILDVSYQDGILMDYILEGSRLDYVLVSGKDGSFYSYVGSMDFMEDKEPVITEVEGLITRLFSDARGELWYVKKEIDQQDTTEWKWSVEKKDSDFGQTDISQYVEETENAVQDAAMDKEGNLYLLIDDEGTFFLVILNKEGELIRKLENIGEVQHIEAMEEGGILIYGYFGNAKMLVAPDKEPEAWEAVADGQGQMVVSAQKENTLLFTKNNSLVWYRTDIKSGEEILDLMSCNIVAEHIADISLLEDGRIAFLLWNWEAHKQLEIAVLKQVRAEEMPEKKTLKLGVITEDSSLNAAVADFNKRNVEYQIEIVLYSENDREEGLWKMNQELISGNGPDIIDLRFMSEDVKTYLDKDILEDLNPFLDKAELIGREDFVPGLLEGYTVNGRLYAVPSAFYIDTIIGKTVDVGTEGGWTPDAFMEFANGLSEETRMFAYEDELFMLRCLLAENIDYFIDWENGERGFAEEFGEMLAFSNEYPHKEGGFGGVDIRPMLQEGTVKLYEASIYDMYQLQACRQYFGEPVTCIGYPSVDGSNGSRLEGTGIVLGINSLSQHKEAAWEFISAQLTKAAQMQKAEGAWYGFPSRLDALDAYFENAMTLDYQYDEDGEILKDAEGEPVQRPKMTIIEYAEDGTEMTTAYYASTREEVDMMKDMIFSENGSSPYNYVVLDIVLEEADFYFHGEKTLEEVVDVIEGRVNLYISEK